NREFYKELYAFKPVEATLPPMGQGGLSLPPNHPPLDGPTQSTNTSPLLNFSPLTLPPPPPVPTAPTAPKAETLREAEKAPAKEAEAEPKTKAEPGKGATAPDLPPDVFTPEKPRD